MLPSDPRSRTSRREQIERLSFQVQELAATLNELILEELQEEPIVPAREPVQAVAQPVDEQPDFEIGERVVIINNYRGNRGLTGVITSVTTYQVSVRLDNNNRIVKKRKHNVRRID